MYRENYLNVNFNFQIILKLQNLQQMGNSRARAVYEANLPDNFRRPQTDSALEAFIRSKYEHKKYIAKEWVQPPLPKVNTNNIYLFAVDI
jgi:stromal membrane-associated protein